MVDSQDRVKTVRSMIGRVLTYTGHGMAVMLLLYVGYFVYSLATGRERVSAICRQITPGMQVEALAVLAQEHGLGPGRLRAGVPRMYLAESRSYGRHACRVDLENGVVTGAEYNFAD